MSVFKYRGGNFERDLLSLERDEFYAPTRDKLNDPFEGMFSRDGIENDLNLFFEILQSSDEEANQAREKFGDALEEIYKYSDLAGIFSLSKTPNEELLWAHYADSHKGFCIEFDLEKLTWLDNDLSKLDIEYQNTPSTVDFEHLADDTNSKFLNTMFGKKSEAWKYEEEVRLISSSSGLKKYDYRAVKAIYFGLNIAETEKNKLMETLKGRGIFYYQMELVDGSYKLTYKEVNDPFIEAPKYKYFKAPIEDYAIEPEYVNKKYRSYIAYLYKAAEIVRREPYCNKVEMVEFSDEKSTPEKPVIFVQYKISDYRWYNHYLSIEEIDDMYSSLDDL
jgi:hypothetical protein